MRNQPNIGRAEMEILHYVYDHHPVTVRDVAEHVAETKGHVPRPEATSLPERRLFGHLCSISPGSA
jgi:hypothetical protein